MSLDSLKIHCAQLYGELSAKTELIKVFKLFDKTGSGRITRRTIREAAAEVGEKMTEDSIREMILVADVNKRGYIEENEFVDFMLVAWGSR